MTAADPRAILIGGLDPSAGAGILLDAFIAAKLGVQPAVVATVVTAQNSAEWLGAEAVSASLVELQLAALAAEGDAVCVKIGALGSAENVEAVASFLRSPERSSAVVLDPVIASTSGGTLAQPVVVEAMRNDLFGLVDIVTPNATEVMLLAPGSASPAEAAASLASACGCAVLVTGLPHAERGAMDLLVTADRSVPLPHRILSAVGDPRGTGCMLATSLACRLVGSDHVSAVAAAQDDVLALLPFACEVGVGRLQLHLPTVCGAD